ncbi:Nn.00g089420.m01.CDS01 [Neocucurbitaria sp. VM-36]
MGVVEFLCDRRFHSSLVLPPNPETGREKPYRVSYADFGDPSSDAVVLFCGALMGARLCYSPLDQLANAYNVRIIHADRPGIGGSDAVELEKRIQIWLEMVPQLLAHLKISHVSLASHSGGDIYLLNTMLTYPNLLHPVNPYVCFFAPWVHPSHSNIMTMRATELLPAPMIGKFASLAKFVNENVIPLAGLSGGLVQGIKGSMLHSNHPPAPVPLVPAATHTREPSMSSHEANHTLALDNPKVVEELRKHITTFLFAESMDGISADAQLFMRKPRSISWCSPNIPWSDIDSVSPLLSKIISEDDRLSKKSRKWTIEVFHAEVDDMVGVKGRQWFDECWRTDRTSVISDSSQSAQPTYTYKSHIVKETDHNFLMDPAFGASETWLQRVREAFPAAAEV